MDHGAGPLVKKIRLSEDPGIDHKFGDLKSSGIMDPVVKNGLEFLRKAYEMVDDPSTDSIISWGFNDDSFIVWNLQECFGDLLPRLFGITDFKKFEAIYGFKKVASGHLEYARDYFLRDKPELLEKIVQSLVDSREKKRKPLMDMLIKCKNLDERKVAYKKWFAIKEMERRYTKEKSLLSRADVLLLRISNEMEIRAKALE